MTDTPPEIDEGIPPKLEEIILGFECLSMWPTPRIKITEDSFYGAKYLIQDYVVNMWRPVV